MASLTPVSLKGALSFISFLATTMTGIILSRFWAQPVTQIDAISRSASTITPLSHFAFGRDNFFKMTASLDASSMTYSDALTIDTFREVIPIQLKWPDGKASPQQKLPSSQQKLRLVLLHGSKFVEAMPMNGKAGLVIRPSLSRRLCSTKDGSVPKRCSLSITIMTDARWKGEAVEFELRASQSFTVPQKHSQVYMTYPYRPIKLAMSVRSDIGRLRVISSCPEETNFGVISKDRLLSNGLHMNRGLAPMHFPGTQTALDVHKGFYFISVRSKRMCSVRIEILTQKEEWRWTAFGRALIIALIVIILTGPSLYYSLVSIPASDPSKCLLE